MVLALDFHKNDPVRSGDAVNILFSPNLFPETGLGAALLTRYWDSVLGGGTLLEFSERLI